MTTIKQAKSDYLVRTLERHIRLHFYSEAASLYQNTQIIFASYDEIPSHENLAPGTIIIPMLSQFKSLPSDAWEVNFRGTKIVLWGFLDAPNDDWQIDDNENPLWYESKDGVFMPAWDMAGILFDLLTLKEEKSTKQADEHGRFIGCMSPRSKNNLLDVPIFNNAAALLVDKCLRNKSPESYKNILFSKPVNICLSHDLDQLRGDDFWTQIARLGRMLYPLKQFRMPDFSQLGFILKNIIKPRKYFMDDLLSMIEVEKKYRFKSVHYILCGKKGRLGARTSTEYISKYLSELSPDCEIGMHYNYDTHLNENAFLNQKKELESIIGHRISSGRAHYLRMDSELSFKFWDQMGITHDESLGYPDKIGYRAGIAGSFFPFNHDSKEELEILSIPLIAMDSCLANTFGSSAVSEVEKHISHLNIVGGTFTLLFHPGKYKNNEFLSTKGMYDKLLAIFSKYEVRCVLPKELLED